jgi:hypothetical protein
MAALGVEWEQRCHVARILCHFCCRGVQCRGDTDKKEIHRSRNRNASHTASIGQKKAEWW